MNIKAEVSCLILSISVSDSMFWSEGVRVCLVEMDGAVLLETQLINILLTPQRNFSNASLSAATTDTPSSFPSVSSNFTSVIKKNHIKVVRQEDVYMVCRNDSYFANGCIVLTYSKDKTVLIL